MFCTFLPICYDSGKNIRQGENPKCLLSNKLIRVKLPPSRNVSSSSDITRRRCHGQCALFSINVLWNQWIDHIDLKERV